MKDTLNFLPHEHGCKVINSCQPSQVSSNACYPRSSLSQVILAEPTLEICVTSEIKLEYPAIELKRVRKDAFIKAEQCKLLPTCDCYKFKLFVVGSIRKNIEYATVDKCSNKQSMCGDIRHTTVYIPFSVCTDLNFPKDGPIPIFSKVDEQFGEFNNLGTGASLNTKFFSNNACYPSTIMFQMLGACFQEFDTGCDIGRITDCCADPVFENISEQIFVQLRLRVLQFQTVPLPAITSGPYCK